MKALLARVTTLYDSLRDLGSSRWYLLVRLAPKAFYACLLRILLGEVLGFKLFSPELVNSFSQSAIFVLAILISGVLEDYKDAERLPASLSAEIDMISEQVELGLVLSAARGAVEGEGGEKEGKVLHREVLHILESIFLFLGSMASDREVLSSLSTHSRFLAARLITAGCDAQGEAVMTHASEVRKLILRLHVIKRTDFLESGTALMTLLVYITIGLAILSSSEDMLEGISFVAFSALQFFYVCELLADLDDPFEYSAEKLLPVVIEEEEEEEEEGEGGEKGTPKKVVTMVGAGTSAEVDLFPIMDLYARLSQRAGRTIGRKDCSQTLCVQRDTGVVFRVPPPTPLNPTQVDFVKALRRRMGEVWREVDGVVGVGDEEERGGGGEGDGGEEGGGGITPPLVVGGMGSRVVRAKGPQVIVGGEGSVPYMTLPSLSSTSSSSSSSFSKSPPRGDFLPSFKGYTPPYILSHTGGKIRHNLTGYEGGWVGGEEMGGKKGQ